MIRTLTRHGCGTGTFLGSVTEHEVGTAFELSTSLGPGDSGGAVVDVSGRLVGVVRGGVDDDPRQTIAIPAERVVELLARPRSE